MNREVSTVNRLGLKHQRKSEAPRLLAYAGGGLYGMELGSVTSKRIGFFCFPIKHSTHTNVKCPLFGFTDAPVRLIKATGVFLPYCGEGETYTFCHEP